MIPLPDQAAAAYLRVIGAAAVYVLADPWGLCRTGVTQHLKRSTFKEQAHFEPKWIGWVAKLEWAHWLALAPQRFNLENGNISALNWEQVRDIICAAATSAKHTITDHETAIKNATQMAQKVRINMDVLKQQGALRPFNAAYKRYNEERRIQRERAVSYNVFQAELANSVACILATGAEPLNTTILTDMRRKFPWLSSVKG